MPEKVTNRWFIAAAGVVMQLALGAVYAWSVFRKPLSEEFDTSVSSVNLAFTLTIVFLGLSAYFGGLWMGKVGPRKVFLHPKLPNQENVRRIFNEVESHGERIELNLYIVGEDSESET